MDTQLLIICILTFVIHLVGTLAYAARIAGQLKDIASIPAAANITRIRAAKGISPWVIALNIAAIALWTTGVFASLYAGYLNPALRVTSSTLSAVVNGTATILMFVFIDPQMSVMTDDVIEGKTSEAHFRRAVVWLVGSRLVGTLLAQVVLIPAAMLIVSVAEIM
jgi:Alternate to MurJ